MFEPCHFWLAFSLTLLAGLSTGIGSVIACFAKRTNTKVLSLALGFSAGVMIYVSFMEILPDANQFMVDYIGSEKGAWFGVLAFFGGILFIYLIDSLIPSYENPHEMHELEEMEDKKMARKFRRLHNVGILTAVAIALHNFPEGIATFVSALSDPALGIAIAVAIAIHNIPEGIAISIPIYYATGSRRKAFFYSFLSGIAEPMGALIGFFALRTCLNGMVNGALFGIVAGIMVYISLDELLPSAQKYGEHQLSIIGLIGGMAVMAVSLLLL